MSTRTLSAYFDDVRKGRKDVALVLQFLLDTYDNEPVRRGHLLNWLDQAQYEHPIPVTDFLLLRKEVEATLKNHRERPAIDEATVIARPGTAAAPDSATLIATAVTTVATQATDLTLAADEGATQISTPPDATPIPERSDHAGLHNAATTIRPSPADTLLQSTPAQPPTPSRSVSRRFLLWSALTLTVIASAGAVMLQFWLREQPPLPAAHTVDPALTEVNQILSSSPAGSIGRQPLQTAPAEIAEMIVPDPIATLDLTALNEKELEQELKHRTDATQLLPVTSPGSAYAALNELAKRFPDSPALLQARIAIKNAHLKASDTARAQGQWELAQQHLDAAFDVLQQAAN